MSDENPKAIVPAILQALPIKELYTDALHPGASELGKAVGQAGSLINSALLPIRSLQLGWDLLFERLDGWLTAKLQSTDPEEICVPSPIVAGGVVNGLLFAQGEPALRDLFVQLLATSMTSSASSLAHPAFAEAIRQMTPVEAKLVQSLSPPAKIPYVFVRTHKVTDGTEFPDFSKHVETLDDDEIKTLLSISPPGPWVGEYRMTLFESDTAFCGPLFASFDNLVRLRIVDMYDAKRLESWNDYVAIVRSPAMAQLVSECNSRSLQPSFARGLIAVTDYGQQFLRACVARSS